MRTQIDSTRAHTHKTHTCTHVHTDSQTTVTDDIERGALELQTSGFALFGTSQPENFALSEAMAVRRVAVYNRFFTAEEVQVLITLITLITLIILIRCIYTTRASFRTWSSKSDKRLRVRWQNAHWRLCIAARPYPGGTIFACIVLPFALCFARLLHNVWAVVCVLGCNYLTLSRHPVYFVDILHGCHGSAMLTWKEWSIPRSSRWTRSACST
jgi:hypothetical protein